ncbi:MAG: hypothetical protein KC486_19580, partial [Myxococcales bacterium]|nr:hypothetical protein [Myxococcales bacterium]
MTTSSNTPLSHSQLAAIVSRFDREVPRDRDAGAEYDVIDCLRAYERLVAGPRIVDADVGLRQLHPKLDPHDLRLAGIQDQEDDDVVLWRALRRLGCVAGPQLRILSEPKDTPPIPALKAAMWGELGPVHRYDLDALAAGGDAARASVDARDRFLDALLRDFADARLVPLLVTAPLGDRGLLPWLCDQLGAAGKEALVLFYSGQYNLRRSRQDVAATLAKANARVVDVSRHPLMRGEVTPTDSLFKVTQSVGRFDAFCRFADPDLYARTRRFRARFNRSLLDPEKAFVRDVPPPPGLVDEARRLWALAADAPALGDGSGPFAAYLAHLRRADVAAHLKPWKRSTAAGFELDAPIADACLALALALL